MTLIDADKLTAYLDQINAFATNRSHAIRADGEDPSYFDGIRQSIDKVKESMAQGKFDPDAPAKTPVKDIKVEAQDLIRKNDGDTSWEAALSAAKGEKRRELYSAIIAALTKWGPMHDEGLAFRLTENHFMFSASGLRTRRNELVKAGWVRDSGERVTTAAQGKSVVWELVPGA